MSTKTFNESIFEDFIVTQMALGLTEAEVVSMYEELAYQQVMEKRNSYPYRCRHDGILRVDETDDCCHTGLRVGVLIFGTVRV